MARHRGSTDGYRRSRPSARPVRLDDLTSSTSFQVPSRAAKRGGQRAPHSPWALHLVVVVALALGGAVGLAVPFENVAGATPSGSGPWLPCTNKTLISGTCVPGYGSAIYNGKDGYEHLLRSGREAEADRFSLILLDLVLPEFSGREIRRPITAC